MTLKKIIVGSLFLLLPLGCFAEPEDQAQLDASYIVEAMISKDLYGAGMDAVGTLMASSLVGEFSKQGKTISERSSVVLGEMLTTRLADEMTEKMKVEMVAVYKNTLSPEALSGFRAFLATDAGREFAEAQPSILVESVAAGEYVGELIVGDVIESMVNDIEAGKFPEKTPIRSQKEIQKLFED